MSQRQDTIRANVGTIRADQEFLMPAHPLKNFEMQKYHQNKPKFNGVYSRKNLTKIKQQIAIVFYLAFVTNLDEYDSVGTHWIALYMNANNTVYFDSFRLEHISKEI